MDKELWESLNKVDELITDLDIINKLLDCSMDQIEDQSGLDGSMNAIIGAKEYVRHLQNEMDVAVRGVWDRLRELSE